MGIKSLDEFRQLYAEMEKAQRAVCHAKEELWGLPEMEPFREGHSTRIGKVAVSGPCMADFRADMEKAGNICLLLTLREFGHSADVFVASRDFEPVSPGEIVPRYSATVSRDEQTGERQYRFERPQLPAYV